MHLITKIFLGIYFFIGQLYALDAQSVYANSSQLFSFDNLRFSVDSVIQKKDSQIHRSFIVAKQTQSTTSSLLIRFKKPTDIRCTAILLKKDAETRQNYVYFPALKRVRSVPMRDEEKEIVGLGVSYADINAQVGKFEPLEESSLNNVPVYKLIKKRKNRKSVYYIKQDDLTLSKIEIFLNEVLYKEVLVQKAIEIKGKKLIVQWSVNDIKKQQTLSYKINEDSISSKLAKNLFYKNRLQRCSF